MSSDLSIRVEALSKAYRIYPTPMDRLRQAVMPRLRRLVAPLLRALGKPVDPPPYFSEFWALRELSFEVARGETVGIIGRNGSGKSTLLQLVCGTLTPSHGEVKVAGRVAALLELGSGFNPEYTGRENVFLNASVLGLSREETEARLADILAFADIGEFVDQPVKTYSSGMAMRLAFAVIAHVDADVLIIDEALAVGDAYFQQKCFRWLRNFQKRGTVLFCGHDPAAIQSLCTRAIWLDRGVKRLEGPAKEVTEAYGAYITAATMGLSPESVRVAPVLHGAAPPIKVEDEADTDAEKPDQLIPLATEGTTFGSGLARIDALAFLDVSGNPLGIVQGGAEIVLTFRVVALEAIERGIAGFTIKDRLGQSIFGDNTYDPGKIAHFDLSKGDIATFKFIFAMPDFAPGQYSIDVAFASGTQLDHVQHHWVHDALIFNVQPRRFLGSLLYIPMIERDIRIQSGDTAKDVTISG